MYLASYTVFLRSVKPNIEQRTLSNTQIITASTEAFRL